MVYKCLFSWTEFHKISHTGSFLKTVYIYRLFWKAYRLPSNNINLWHHLLTQTKQKTFPSLEKDQNLLDVLKEVRQKRQDDWRSVNTIVDNHSDWFLDLTDRVKLPEWFDPKKEDVGQAVKLLDWMLDMAAVLYV